MFCPHCQADIASKAHFCPNCGSDLAFSDKDLTQTIAGDIRDLSPGDVFGKRYEIIRELGRGGMGIVYLAQDKKLKRSVALKLLPIGLSHLPEIKARFLREAQAAAGLDHPHICTVYESDEADGRPFISMAFIEGQELKKLIEKNVFESEKALEIASQIALGLDAAHTKGIVHRDIKSGNIMVTSKGQAKIMDFGIAKMVGTTLLTQEGTTMGTAAYMSPEQARGEQLDFRTDLWSLGVILYQMLSAHLPFPGETAQAVIYAILHEPPLPLVHIDSLSTEVEKIILKALSKDIRYRYASAEVLLKDLHDLRAGIPVKAGKEVPQKSANSVAVLDFTNITKDADCDWLSGGIAETVTVDLKRISSLQVISREKILKGLDKGVGNSMADQDVIALGKKLGIGYVVWGGFQKMGKSVRITSYMTEVSSGNLMGSAKVDGIMTDIFKLQDEIIIQLADFLSLEVSDTEKAKIELPETIELEAYEYYARGRQLTIQLGREGMTQAQEHYEKALELDPEYALAYSGLGGLLTLKFITSSRNEDLELGIKYLQESIKRDTELSDPFLWLTYGYTRKFRFDEAVRSGKRAVELETDNPLAHYFLGLAYHVQAAVEYKKDGYPQALDHYRINLKLVPKYEPALLNSAWIYLLHGCYPEAKKLLEQAVMLEESGKGEMVRFVGSLTLMGNLFLRQNHTQSALEWYKRSIEILEKTDHVYTQAFLALAYCGLASIDFMRWDHDKALANFKKARAAIEKGKAGLGMGYILVYVLIGMAKAFHGLGITQESKHWYQTALKLLSDKKEYDFNWIWEGCDAQAYYEIANFQALLNHPTETYEYLEKAVKSGWADWPAFDCNASFEEFRKHPDYRNKIQELRKTPDILEGVSL